MADLASLQATVSGRVHGVFFRAFVESRALELNLTGYVRNLPDGRVEALACGPKSLVDDFCAWLSQGPLHAEVSNVTCQPFDAVPPREFTEQ